MRVLVLHSDVASDAPPEELDTLITSHAIAGALRELGHEAALAPFVASPEGVRAAVRDARADVVFNMVESVFGQDSLAALAPAILENLAIPYTGSASAPIALASNKPLAKRVMRSGGLPTPDWAELPHWEGLGEDRRYVVKAANEDASLGLDDHAVVLGRQAIAARARACMERFGGIWFAEGYIEGREFNVALLEEDGVPRILPIPEMRFEGWPDERPRIIGYSAKWDEESEECAMTARVFGLENDDATLAAQLGELAQKAWHLFGMRAYIRVDFRVDETGCPMILEVNPNPSLEPQVGFAVTAAQAGIAYPDLIARILGSAFGN